MVWISLYYFTFEIADIKITISEPDPAKLQKAKRRNKIIGYLSIGFLCLNILITLVEISISSDYKAQDLYNWPLFILRMIKITLDVGIHIYFLHLFIYIMKIKHANAKEENN